MGDVSDWRLKLQTYDRVIVRDDLGAEAEWVVKYPPRQLGHGAWVIGLKGIAGGYDLNRVIRLADNALEKR